MRNDGTLGFVIGIIGFVVLLLLALICDIQDWSFPLG
jgi:hypothetical protein